MTSPGSSSGTRRLLGASRLCGALGLHVVALKLETQAWDLIRGRKAKARHPSELLQQVQVAIYRGDLKQAKDFSQTLRDRLAPKVAALYSYVDVFNYISLWSGNESRRFPGESESLSHRWNSELAGRRLHVYGPGVTTGDVAPIPGDEKVSRILFGTNSPSTDRYGEPLSARISIVPESKIFMKAIN